MRVATWNVGGWLVSSGKGYDRYDPDYFITLEQERESTKSNWYMIVGDKVICIKDYNDSGWLSKNYSVTKGQLYEVSDTLVKDRIRVKEKGNSYYPTELFITLNTEIINSIRSFLNLVNHHCHQV